MSHPSETGQLTLFEPIGWFMGAFETWAVGNGYPVVLGVDEAGRGPLAGPVVAAAVRLDLERAGSEGWLDSVADSKALDRRQREHLFDRIRTTASCCAVAQAEAPEIDRLNILRATLMAMRQAVGEAAGSLREGRVLVCVDGNTRIPGIDPQATLIKGDARSYHVAAASILAKVTRDRILERYHAHWPDYGFDVHKGYPTPEHRERLAVLGPTPVHRRTFGVEALRAGPA